MPENESMQNTEMTQKEAPIVDAAEMDKTQKIIEATDNAQAAAEIGAKIDAVENILVALSNEPSEDEIAAAIGLTLALDKMGKHATAIYSGKVPETLKFLAPEETLEKNADSLQDLVISLTKEKADHLRYKVDGDFVKIYITPYRTKLTEDDFKYSYGDYNVSLVIALNVRTATNLDNVLREHGRIMSEASAIDITTGAPGRFGEIEWSNPAMSSISEMVTSLLIGLKKPEITAEIATPLLAGIVSATERFKNERTSSDTMKMAGRLMEAGANVQVIAENLAGPEAAPAEPVTDMAIDVNHEDVPEPVVEEPETEEEPEPELPAPVDAPILNDELMEELKRQQEEAKQPEEESEPAVDIKDYGKMIDEALAELNAAAPVEPVMETETPAAGDVGVPEPVKAPVEPAVEMAPEVSVTEPAAEPMVAEVPVATGPELPMPNAEILPPPPTPEVNFEAPTMPEVAPEMPAVTEPVAPVIPEAPAPTEAPVVPETPAANDPSQFRIPGM